MRYFSALSHYFLRAFDREKRNTKLVADKEELVFFVVVFVRNRTLLIGIETCVSKRLEMS